MIFEFGRREGLAPFICTGKSFRESALRFLETGCGAFPADSVTVSAMDWHSESVEATGENSDESSPYDIGFEFAFVNPIANSATINSKELRHFFY